jgi:GTP-binding protein HflX
VPVIALIGYTNVGKTALTNLCANSDLSSEDQLFQTLNVAQRKVQLIESNQNAIMMDTVGFITNLPHSLVASFKSTLKEIHTADILVHVRDVSHPACDF